MILSVQMTLVLDRDRTINHTTEVIVDNETEAHERGEEFLRLMLAFNRGILEGMEAAA